MTKGVALRVFLPFALGYFVASIFRSINAVISPNLVQDLGLNARELGFATSAFFLSATALQLPYGILLDRFDPRKTYTCCLLLGALGGVVTATSGGVVLLAIGRGLIAISAAASAVTSYKVYATWYAPERLPLVNGLSIAAGGLGLMAGTAPVEAALHLFDWREIHLIVASFLVLAGVLVILVAPKTEAQGASVTFGDQITGLRRILTSLVFWRAAPLTMVVVGIYAGVSTLWAGPWVRDVAGISGIAAANILLILTAGLAAAGLVTGWLTGIARRIGLTPMGFAAVTAIIFAVVLLILYQQWVDAEWEVMALWSMFGLLAPLNLVTYAALGTQFPKEVGGRLNACLTLSWMSGAFLLQNLYGWVLDRFPSRNGAYSVEGHHVAMGLLLLGLLCALAWFAFASLLLRRRSMPEDCS